MINAQETADSLAQAAGIHLGKIINIQEDLPTFPEPVNDLWQI